MHKRMRVVSRRSPLIGSLVVGLLSLAIAWPGAAAAADLHTDARSIQIEPASSAPAPTAQTVIEHQWYVVDGGFNGVADRYVTIGRIAPPVACKSSEPLLASLYNPAGFFIRRLQPTSNGTYRFAVPRLDGRYLLKLRIADPTCSGLSHTIVQSRAPTAASHDSSLTAQVRECTLAKNKVAADRYALGHPHSAASGKRYAGFLKRDQSAQQRACPVNA